MSADVLINTRASQYHVARLVNQTSSSFVAKNPQFAEPVGDAGTATGSSVIDIVQCAEGNPQSGSGQNGIELCFFGTGSNANTFSCRIIGWSAVGSDRLVPVTPAQRLWIPIVLAEVKATLNSSITGVANSILGTAQLFADTIALVGTSANQGVGVDIVSAANTTIAYLYCDLRAAQKVELSFTTGGSATDCNALYKLF